MDDRNVQYVNNVENYAQGNTQACLLFSEHMFLCVVHTCSVFPTGQASICGGVVGGRGVAAAAAMTKKNAELEYNYNTLCTYLYTD